MIMCLRKTVLLLFYIKLDINSSHKDPHSSMNGGNGSGAGTGLYELVILKYAIKLMLMC